MVQHPGAVVFMFVDAIILISCGTLMTAQLYQVSNLILSLRTWFQVSFVGVGIEYVDIMF